MTKPSYKHARGVTGFSFLLLGNSIWDQDPLNSALQAVLALMSLQAEKSGSC